MSTNSFEQFCQIVLEDPALQGRLMAVPDHDRFVELVVQAGEDRGCKFTPAEVEAALNANRKAWLQGRMMA